MVLFSTDLQLPGVQFCFSFDNGTLIMAQMCLALGLVNGQTVGLRSPVMGSRFVWNLLVSPHGTVKPNLLVSPHGIVKLTVLVSPHVVVKLTVCLPTWYSQTHVVVTGRPVGPVTWR